MSHEQAQVEITNEEYHKLSSVSHSWLECFRRSKRTYKATYIDKTLRKEQTPSMMLGSLVHSLILEPQAVGDRYSIAPKCDRRTTIGKQAWAAFLDEAYGREVVDLDTWQQAEMVSNAVLTNATAKLLLNVQCEIEKPMYWTCPKTAVACRCKPDFLSVFGMPYMIDIKTCQDATPSGFASSAARYGYARQAAWYQWGHEENGMGKCSFIFVAVSTHEPHEVGIYQLSDRDIERSRIQNEIDLVELKSCMESGEWQALHERSVATLQLPKWVEYEDQYQTY